MTNVVRDAIQPTSLTINLLTFVRKVEDVQALLNGKLALRYATVEMEAMRAVATAHANSSLKQFQEAVQKYTQGTFPNYQTLTCLISCRAVCRLEGRFVSSYTFEPTV